MQKLDNAVNSVSCGGIWSFLFLLWLVLYSGYLVVFVFYIYISIALLKDGLFKTKRTSWKCRKCEKWYFKGMLSMYIPSSHVLFSVKGQIPVGCIQQVSDGTSKNKTKKNTHTSEVLHPVFVWQENSKVCSGWKKKTIYKDEERS